jgi:retron-type reverse transcriptase
LNVFSKIIEKAIKTRLINYLEKYNLLPTSQYGFRKGLGTEDALANLTKYIYDTLDNHNKTIGILLDLSKAYDTIPHTKLLNRRKSFGITGSAYSIFKSYLEYRIQVKIGNTLSEIGIIHRGVPQSTVLSPILYIMYVSALDILQLNKKIYSYADDTAIIVSNSNWESTWQKN